MPLSKKFIKKRTRYLFRELKKEREYLLSIRDEQGKSYTDQEWIAKKCCSDYSYFNKIWVKLVDHLTKK